ncbi:hypothetical protein VM1G_02110 [Cytospora mali]|uniref:DNL-type domain-containing protein n=1 Tax=Cytospora mali TaxID=578113 RepID=A0A194VRM3_CYTMA|nr:hypothetical protein VM1G_02110 [Valsa mali]
MASKGLSAGTRALARTSKAAAAPTRPTYLQAQTPALQRALCSSTTRPAQRTITPRLFTRALSSTPKRQEHSIPRPPPSQSQANTPRQPSYELTFTCVPCGTRSAHNISKQGYHYGSVLITCPSCRNRHIISDHLNIFGNRKITVEDLMKERGRLVKRGTLGEDGDLEFWEDGSTTNRSVRQGEGMDPKPKVKSEPAAENGEAEAPGSTFGKA